ncbi:tetratricopeptide repeat protein [Terracidiphilus gabretensis]|jgi:tetratricopeptide (TPR) repeat protein|uniref:tetratricopeptide repeat protein n=1 Tax=Terracidiphilus gabretensis TaxID=1577687 RepID=UPI0009E9C05A|nr:tetratricopeptide repeat protein [Terracidiphilus gabretensis]
MICKCISVVLLGLLSFSSVPSGFCQLAPDTQSQIQTHLSEAHKFLNENRPDAAIPEFRAILALDPSNIDALGNLGVLLFFHGDYAGAIPNLHSALQRKPDLWKLQALLGMAERRTGKPQTARTDLEASFTQLQDQKIRIEAGLELVELYTSAEEMDKASAIVSTLRALDPENQQIIYTAYRVHSDMAREDAMNLALIAPHSALMYQLMSHEAARRGDTPAAIRDEREALRLDPNIQGVHFELAELLNASMSENDAEIKSQYELALKQNPLDEKTQLRLGAIAERNHDQKTALALYTQAVALQPDDPEACYDLGKLLFSVNEIEMSEKLLTHAAQMDPTNANIHFRLATVYKRLGRDDEAKREVAQYQKYKDLKEKLRETFRELHVDPKRLAQEEGVDGSKSFP